MVQDERIENALEPHFKEGLGLQLLPKGTDWVENFKKSMFHTNLLTYSKISTLISMPKNF